MKATDVDCGIRSDLIQSKIFKLNHEYFDIKTAIKILKKRTE